MYGAVILSIAAIVAKIMGAFFRIPLTNMIGDEGMAYYQAVYPVYTLLFTLTNAGIPVAVSRMVSERLVYEDYYDAHRVFKVAFGLLVSAGFIMAVGLFVFSEPITGAIKDVSDAVFGMKAIAPALFFVSVNSAFKGYFQGMQTMMPTAIAQVTEQLFKVIVGLVLAFVLVPKGIQYAAAGATFGATAGGMAATVFLLYAYHRLKSNRIFSERLENSRLAGRYFKRLRIRKIILTMFGISIPIMIGSAILPAMTYVDLAIVTGRLSASGLEPEAVRGLYGQLTGMAGALLNIPQIFMQAIAISLVPTIVAAFKKKDSLFLNHNIELSLRTAVLIGMPCTIGVFVLAKPILLLLYPSQALAAASAAPSLTILALGMVFMSLLQILTAILQGVEKQMIPVRNLLIAVCFKIVITFFLTGIKPINIKGAACGTVVANIIASMLNMRSVKKYTDVKINHRRTFMAPLLSSAIMGAIAFATYYLFRLKFGNAISVMIAIILAVFAYIIAVFATKSITPDELLELPKGVLLHKIYMKTLGRFSKKAHNN
jgi:stage V sporulation protein B